MNHKETILFFYMKTGGGHLAPARSIASEILRTQSDKYEPVLCDVLLGAPWIVRFILETGYRELQSWAVWYYEFLYLTNKFRPIALWNRFLATLSIKNHIKELIREHNPGKLIVLHFFIYNAAYKAVEELGRDIKIYTIVTDPFTAHPLWFIKKEQEFIIFSERLKKHCLKLGIEERRLHLFSPIINNQFNTRMSAEEVKDSKRELGLSTDKKTVLMLGGGDGVPGGAKILEKLLSYRPDYQIIIVCGRNNALYNSAARIREKYNAENVFIFKFVDFVYKLINVSDVVITKCGASTIMEILLQGKVPIIIEYIWEQEKGNMEYVINNGMGLYIKNHNKLKDAVIRLLHDKEYYDKFVSNINKNIIKNGTEDITRFILSN